MCASFDRAQGTVHRERQSRNDINTIPAVCARTCAASFIDGMASGIYAKNPEPLAGTSNYFSRKQSGDLVSEGIEHLCI